LTTLIIGCGFLGLRVARRLVARGERVFGTSRGGSRASLLREAGIEPIAADVLQPATLQVLPTADRALFCVGYDRSTGLPMRTVYVDGLRHALEALRGRVGHLVYASATSVYGQTDGGWVDEDAPTEPRETSGRVCLDAETLAEDFAADRGLSLSIVRFSGLYGPGRIIRRAALERGEPIEGDPSKYLNLIHIDDAAAAAVAALERGSPGRVYLATDDRPVTREEYYTRAAACLGAPAPRFVSPEKGGRAGLSVANKQVSNRRLKDELGVVLAYPDITTGLPAALIGR
jgi:nucleoside-diphosphate-sugar epimerase